MSRSPVSASVPRMERPLWPGSITILGAYVAGRAGVGVDVVRLGVGKGVGVGVGETLDGPGVGLKGRAVGLGLGGDDPSAGVSPEALQAVRVAMRTNDAAIVGPTLVRRSTPPA